MLHRIPSSPISGEFIPTLAWLLASVVAFGTTARGDSSSDRQPATTVTPGVLSTGSTISTISTAKSNSLGGSGDSSLGSLSGSSASDGPPILTDVKNSVEPSLADGFARIADLPIVNGNDTPLTRYDGQDVGRETRNTCRLSGLVRLLVFGTFGFLVMRRLQHHWKT